MAAIVAVAGYNVYQSQSVMNSMSEFALANVEALAQNENETFPCLYRITYMCSTIDWSIPWQPIMTQYPDSYDE